MFYYKIAGITIGVEGDWPQLAKSRLADYEIKAETCQGAPKCDVHYVIHQECDHIVMPDAAHAVEMYPHTWMNLKDGGYARVDRVPEFSDKILNCIVANHDWSEIHGYLCREDFSGLPKDFRAFNVIGATLHYVLFRRNGMELHSSCISYRGQAVLFSAPSGTGKSTHTRLWKEFYPETVIINDDMPALRMLPDESGEETAYAFGTPWAGKTQTNENISAPVRAIVFLKQAKENAIRRVSGGEAAFLVLQGARKPLLEDLMSDSLDVAAKLMDKVPAYELSCTISREAVELVRSELFGKEA